MKKTFKDAADAVPGIVKGLDATVKNELARAKNNTENLMDTIAAGTQVIKDHVAKTTKSQGGAAGTWTKDMRGALGDLADSFSASGAKLSNCTQFWDIAGTFGALGKDSGLGAAKEKAIVETMGRNKACFGDAAKWGADIGKKLGDLATQLPVADLQKMAGDALETLGDKLTGDQLAGLGKKFETMTDAALAKLVATVNATSLLRAAKGLGKQLEGGLKLGAKRSGELLKKMKASDEFGAIKDWTSEKLGSLGGLVAGLDTDDLEALSKDALKGALAHFGKVTSWTDAQRKQLAGKAQAAIGDVGSWSEAQYEEVGTLIAGVASSEWPKMNVKFAVKLNGSTFQLIDWTADPNNFKKLVPLFGELKDVSADKAKALLKGAKAAFGAAEVWGAAALDDLDNLVAAVDLDDLRKISGAAWAKTKAAAKLTKEQIAALKETIERMLPTELADLAAKLDKEAFKAALAKLGNATRYTGEQAAVLLGKTKDCLGAVKTWTGAQIGEIKDIMAGIPVEEIKDITRQAFKDALKTLGAVTNWSEKQLAALKVQLVAAFGAAETWTADTAAKIGTLAAALNDSEVAKMSKAAVKAAIDASQVALGKAKVKATSLLKKAAESEVYGKVQDWTVANVNALGALAGDVLGDKVKDLSDATFKATAAVLADVKDWSAKQRKDLAAKAVVAFGSAKTWTKETGEKLGSLLGSLDAAELKECAGAAIKGALGKAKDLAKLTKEQAAGLAKRIKESDVYGKVADWSGDKLTQLGQFASTVVDKEDIKAMSKQAFADSLAALKDVQGWSKEQAGELAGKAKEAFADCKTWTKETASKMGDLMAGLAPIDLSTLSFEASITIIPGAAEKMSADQAKSFDAKKLGGMPKDTRDRFNGKKLEGMTKEQRKGAVCPEGGCPASVLDIKVKKAAGVTLAQIRAWVAKALKKAEKDITILTDVADVADEGAASAGRRLRALAETATTGGSTCTVRTNMESSAAASSGASALESSSGAPAGATVSSATAIDVTATGSAGTAGTGTGTGPNVNAAGKASPVSLAVAFAVAAFVLQGR